MATRRTTRKKKTNDQYIQFSKRLVTAVMIFWGVIRLISVVAALINPDSSTHMAAIVAGVDEIAMVNCLAYTGNSVSEKLALGYFQMRERIAENENEEDGNENKESVDESCG